MMELVDHYTSVNDLESGDILELSGEGLSLSGNLTMLVKPSIKGLHSRIRYQEKEALAPLFLHLFYYG